MYKKIAILALLIALLAFPIKVFAATCPTCQAANTSLQNTLQNTLQNQIKDQRKVALEEFRARLTELKDQRKALILQRISEQIDDKNSRWMTHFENVLTRLTAILEKIKTRTDKAETAGLDVSTVRTLITEAETAIQTASDAIAAQEGKSYAIDISDETALGVTAGEVIKELRDDLTTVRELVFDARQAVVDVLKALGLVLENEELE